jgi:hypothetical protein
MTPPSPSVTRFDHVDDTLAAALGSELAATWRMPSGPQLRTIWVGYSGADLAAAVLTSSRPATAATKIARTWRATDTDGADAALDNLVDTVINDARDRGDIAVKWQSFDEDLPPQHRGFIAMRTPYQSAAGTEGVRGYVLWLNPVTHDEPPYYSQTSTFTCGAVAALLASEVRGSRGFSVDGNNRDRELAFWRQASNFPACEPIGLAVALRGSISDAAGSAPVDVFLDTNGPALLETFPDGFDRKFREELQADSLRQALSSDIAVHRNRLSMDELATRIYAGELALILINTQLMYGFAVPHWVLAHSVEQGLVIIDDPTISHTWGETWVDAHEIPVSLENLDHMVAWGDVDYRGVIFIRRP